MSDEKKYLDGRFVPTSIEPWPIKVETADTIRAERDQLRAEVQLLKDCCADWEEHHAVQVKAIGELRAGLAALVDALPKCDAVTVRGPDMSRLCGKPSTHYEVGAWGGECPCPTIDARCDEHKEHFEEAPWSAPLRAAIRLLGRES